MDRRKPRYIGTIKSALCGDEAGNRCCICGKEIGWNDKRQYHKAVDYGHGVISACGRDNKKYMITESIVFKCDKCGKIYIVPYKQSYYDWIQKVDKNDTVWKYPNGWTSRRDYDKLLCPDCDEELEKLLKPVQDFFKEDAEV